MNQPKMQEYSENLGRFWEEDVTFTSKAHRQQQSALMKYNRWDHSWHGHAELLALFQQAAWKWQMPNRYVRLPASRDWPMRCWPYQATFEETAADHRHEGDWGCRSRFWWCSCRVAVIFSRSQETGEHTLVINNRVWSLGCLSNLILLCSHPCALQERTFRKVAYPSRFRKVGSALTDKPVPKSI